MSISYHLRPAVKADAKLIKALVTAENINPTGLKWPHFFVAETPDGTMIGCGQLKPHQDGSVELASLVVPEKFRGQGIARAIIEHLIAQHPEELYLMCRSGLEGFYEKFGFVSIKNTETMPRYFKRMVRIGRVMAKIVLSDGQTISIMVRMPNPQTP